MRKVYLIHSFFKILISLYIYYTSNTIIMFKILSNHKYFSQVHIKFVHVLFHLSVFMFTCWLQFLMMHCKILVKCQQNTKVHYLMKSNSTRFNNSWNWQVNCERDSSFYLNLLIWQFKVSKKKKYFHL